MTQYLLSSLLFLPLLAALLVALWPNERQSKYIALVALVAEGFLGWQLYQRFNVELPGFQLTETFDWITLSLGSLGTISVDYALGVDGVNIALVLLAIAVAVIGLICSWDIRERSRAYFALYLMLTGTIVGCFLARDLFLFYLFFEFMLLPMYFLIGLWGGPRREYAALKFFIYTFAGSLLILIAMIGLHLAVVDPVELALRLGFISDKSLITPELISQVQLMLADGDVDSSLFVHTFRYEYLADFGNYIPDSFLNPNAGYGLLGMEVRSVAFWFLFIGLAVKLPIVPLHTWLPDAHVEAPTPISVVLAGILLKVGGYGLIRLVIGFFPAETWFFGTALGILSVLSIVYGGFNALAQKDLKKLIAYSSVSHMGFVLLGIVSLTAEGINGAIYQMVSHGILSSMLFIIAGVLYDRTHDRTIDNYQGLIHPMPAFTIFTGVAFFASLGLPGFSGFIGEFFTLMGAFRASSLPVWVPVLSTIGIVLGAGYLLWTYQKMYFGGFWYRKDPSIHLHDLTYGERGLLFVLGLATFLTGIFPHAVFKFSNATVHAWLETLK